MVTERVGPVHEWTCIFRAQITVEWCIQSPGCEKLTICCLAPSACLVVFNHVTGTTKTIHVVVMVIKQYHGILE
jgi:hypothetical protein